MVSARRRLRRLRGWNTEPYLGQGEFYLEYGDFTLEVTVPAGYIVAATGALENAARGAHARRIARLAQAAKSDSAVQIVTPAKISRAGPRGPKKPGH